MRAPGSPPVDSLALAANGGATAGRRIRFDAVRAAARLRRRRVRHDDDGAVRAEEAHGGDGDGNDAGRCWRPGGRAFAGASVAAVAAAAAAVVASRRRRRFADEVCVCAFVYWFRRCAWRTVNWVAM